MLTGTHKLKIITAHDVLDAIRLLTEIYGKTVLNTELLPADAPEECTTVGELELEISFKHII
jgi:hypothetical protein